MVKHKHINFLLRILGFTFGGMATVVAALALYIWLSLDVQGTQETLIHYMSDHYQRKLSLGQDIKLSLWPWPALEISELSLSEPKSNTVALTLRHAHVELVLSALLRRQPVVRHIDIDEADAHLVRSKDGRWSANDLFSAFLNSDAQTPSTGAFQAGQIIVNNLSVSVLDQRTEHLYTLKQARLVSGLLQPDTQDSLWLQGEWAADWPAMRGNLNISADYSLGAPGNGHLDNIAIRYDGRFDDIRNSRATLNADTFSWTNSDWQWVHTQAEIKGTGEQSTLGFSAQLPQLKSTQGAWQADKASAQLMTQIQNRPHTIQLSLQNLSTLKEQLKAENIQVDWSAGNDLHTHLASPLTGNLETGVVEMPELKGETIYDKEQSPIKLEGNAKWNTRQEATNKTDKIDQAAQINLTVSMAQSDPLQISAQVQTLRPLVTQLNISGARLDLATQASSQNKQPPNWQPEVDEVLKTVEITKDSSISLNELVLPSLSMQNVRIPLLLKEGNFSSISHSMKIAGGLVSGNLTYHSADQGMNGYDNFSNVDLTEIHAQGNELLHLSGKASGTLEYAAQGNTIDLLRKNLKGKLQFAVSHAELSGISLEKLVHDFHAPWLAQKPATKELMHDEKTALNDASALFNIEQGHFNNKTIQSSNTWSKQIITMTSTPASAQMQLSINKTLPKDAPREASDLREKTFVIYLKKEQEKRQASTNPP